MMKTVYEKRRMENGNNPRLNSWIRKSNAIREEIKKDYNQYSNPEKSEDYDTAVEAISKWKDVDSGRMTSKHGVTQYWDILKKLAKKYL